MKVMKPVTRMFDKDSVYWIVDQDCNMWYIHNVEFYLNSYLEHGLDFVSLNDAFDKLGIPRTKEGQMFVWKKHVVFEVNPIADTSDIEITFCDLESLF